MDAAARAGLFVDREGVLIGDDEDDAAAGATLLPGVIETLRRLAARGVVIALVSDRPSSDDSFARTQERLDAALAAAGCPLAGAWHSTTARKPLLMLRAARALNIDLRRSWLIGCDADDARAGAEAGCAGVVVVGGGDLPGEDLGITVAGAADLADAPRVMIPRSGGCWHE